mmetsp:Transcript_18731/g.46378  ORF Transcript_18731/g.46378 Transcript_18731/m.46378 type:complete len:93 (-) Transcript_18731:36-314(-)
MMIDDRYLTFSAAAVNIICGVCYIMIACIHCVKKFWGSSFREQYDSHQILKEEMCGTQGVSFIYIREVVVASCEDKNIRAVTFAGTSWLLSR